MLSKKSFFLRRKIASGPSNISNDNISIASLRNRCRTTAWSQIENKSSNATELSARRATVSVRPTLLKHIANGVRKEMTTAPIHDINLVSQICVNNYLLHTLTSIYTDLWTVRNVVTRVQILHSRYAWFPLKIKSSGNITSHISELLIHSNNSLHVLLSVQKSVSIVGHLILAVQLNFAVRHRGGHQ